MDPKPDITERLQRLTEKFETMGQDMNSYLDGLLYSRYLTYWDYVQLDTLLSLQKPRTDFPDEAIFIGYHQVTELYFKLILSEMHQLCDSDSTELPEWYKRLGRINNYFRILTHSFEVMIEGMDREQFMKFRMALLPASGFQSVQYRMIEVMSSDLINLVNHQARDVFTDESSLSEIYEQIYWKYGNIEMKSGKKTLTLRMFEEKYDQELLELIARYRNRNILQRYNKLPAKVKSDPKLIGLLKDLDINGNVFWPLSHYKSAVRYLFREPEVIEATGGTNWQKYLPPRFQKVIFFPELWTKEEKANWGKKWVIELFKEQVERTWTEVG
jgi:tryptophan 2,3-dioxygenase